MKRSENPLSHEIIGAAIDIHKQLGPGLLESAYEGCLAHALSLRGISVERQKTLKIVYKGTHIDCGYRLDLIVDGLVIVELKMVGCLEPIHVAQVPTYLRLSGVRLGLLINFNVTNMKQGIKRVVNNL